ncbi:MAG: low molecular weight phosphotyrosine protein phosphatase [Actinomycetales bacterium]|nr:low molecular weight phosphotyrosine protein phosphatase [Actinomycetales bacterium]
MRRDARYRVCFVCSGNICRSPMGEVVLRQLAEDGGVGHLVAVDSAGTGDWHIGERADRRTLAALAKAGYDGDAHRARQFDPHWFAERDLVIAMDRGHERTLRSWAGNERDRSKVRLLRSFDPALGPGARHEDLDVRDPYYDGARAFAEVLAQIETACRGLLDHVRAETTGRAAG